jgi:hypothetical protein
MGARMNDKSNAPGKAAGNAASNTQGQRGESPGLDPALIEQHRQDSLRDDGRNPGRPIPEVPLAKHVNHTPFWSQYFQTVDSAGEVFHTVVTRVSYDMTSVARGEQGGALGVLGYCAEQSELAMGDEFADPDQPNASELLWESDFCTYKPRCDVLVVNAVTRPPLSHWQRTVGRLGNPQPVPAEARWSCGVSLLYQDESGHHRQWHKTVGVTGPRSTTLLRGVSDPKAAHEVRLGWANAFGGPGDERNPLGVGHASSKSERQPQQELTVQPYGGGLLQRNYPPVHLGPLGKAWLPRRTLAGTYDNAWLKNQWPLPPADLDDGFWNCAPADQQVEHPEPGAQITLVNLWPPTPDTPEGQRPPPPEPGQEVWRARLPLHQLFVLPLFRAMNIGGGLVTKAPALPCRLDTLRLDLQAQRVEATYRCRVPQSVFGRHPLVRMETRMCPVGQALESVPPEELGPLGE